MTMRTERVLLELELKRAVGAVAREKSQRSFDGGEAEVLPAGARLRLGGGGTGAGGAGAGLAAAEDAMGAGQGAGGCETKGEGDRLPGTNGGDRGLKGSVAENERGVKGGDGRAGGAGGAGWKEGEGGGGGGVSRGQDAGRTYSRDAGVSK
jgi:uncharacterized protein